MDTQPGRIRTLASAIASDNDRALEQLFGGGDIPAAVFRWHFDGQALPHAPLRELYERWSSVDDLGALVDMQHARPQGFSDDALDYLMLVEPDGDYARVFYHYYGAGIRRAYGRDLTGESSSSFSGPLATFFVGAYLATELRGAPLLTRHMPPKDVPVRHWNRLILPPIAIPSSVSRTGTVWFLAANVPVLD